MTFKESELETVRVDCDILKDIKQEDEQDDIS